MATDPSKLHDLSGNSIPGFDDKPGTDPESASAIDAAFKQAGGNPDKPDEGLAEVAEPKAKEKPAAPAKPAPPIKADVEEDDEPKVAKDFPNAGDALDAAEKAARTPEPKADENKPKAEPKADDKPSVIAEKDEFDAIELPINVKPKTVESFDKAKALARERIAAVNKEKEALAKEVEELKGKVTQGLPKEVETELKTLREFRAKIEVEADPNWSNYDKTIAENTEAIYAKLLATPGITKENIEAIKGLGGAGAIDWDDPAIKLPPQVRRFLDAKLVENETIAEKKNKAIADAKNNALQYIATRREEQTKGAELQNKAVETEIETLLPKFPWFKELKAKDGATDAEKKAVEKHNALIEESRKTLKMAAEDNSPAMRSILAVGYAQLLKTREDFADYRSTAEAEKAKHTEEKAALTKELEEVKAKLDKIKKSSTTRLRDTPAEDVNGGRRTKQVDLNTPGGDALDQHLAARNAEKE